METASRRNAIIFGSDWSSSIPARTRRAPNKSRFGFRGLARMPVLCLFASPRAYIHAWHDGLFDVAGFDLYGVFSSHRQRFL